jgi:uncharacterized protein DUF4411
VRYSIDTSSLINGLRLHYPYESFPRLWNEDLPSLVVSGDLRATEEVRIELDRQDDELVQWIEGYSNELFVEVDEEIQHQVRGILARHPALIHAGRGRSGADPFVIALAKMNDCTVVTEERNGSAKHPKIPDVCGALDLRCIRLIELIREQGWVYG